MDDLPPSLCYMDVHHERKNTFFDRAATSLGTLKITGSHDRAVRPKEDDFGGDTQDHW